MATGSKLGFLMISFPQASQCIYVSGSTSFEESDKLVPMKDIYLPSFLRCDGFVINNFSVLGWGELAKASGGHMTLNS